MIILLKSLPVLLKQSMSLFSFLNVSPRSELRIRKRKAESVKLKYKLFESKKEERLARYMSSLAIEDIVADVLGECVDSVCEAEKSKMVRSKAKELNQRLMEEKSVPEVSKPRKKRILKRKHKSST